MWKTQNSPKRAFILICMTLFVYCLLALPLVSKGTVIWADNFNDGNYNGWAVYGGQFIVSSGILQITGTEDGMIYRNSTVAVGTWSWDMLDNDRHTPVTFMGTDEDLHAVFAPLLRIGEPAPKFIEPGIIHDISDYALCIHDTEAGIVRKKGFLVGFDPIRGFENGIYVDDFSTHFL